MNTDDYLSEHCSAAIVPDLVLRGKPVKLVFILESPHSYELSDGIPVAGAAGRSALRYLLAPTATVDSLGNFVKQRHAAGDSRLAILNVSRVPLQEGAFRNHRSRGLLAGVDWSLLESVRNSTAQVRNSTAQVRKSTAQSVSAKPNRNPAAIHADDILFRGLQARVDDLAMSTDCVVVACGRFAGRFGRALGGIPGGQPSEVPHPSYNLWKGSGKKAEQLGAMKEWFTRNIRT